MNNLIEIGGEVPTNGAKTPIEAQLPYIAEVKIEGVADILFHRWNCEAVEAKAKAPKNSAAKKMDDVETYIYRDDKGYICLPGEYLRQSIINAAKFRQDPRSPRKSAMDLFKAGIVSLTTLASLGSKNWDYLDTRRAGIHRAGINRSRPAFRAGWQAQFDILINLPEYITSKDLLDVINMAGRLIGVGDFRPSYGRFSIVHFKVR